MSVRERTLNKVISCPPAQLDGGPWGGGKMTWTGRQYTSSEGHKRSPNGKYYEGGPFLTYRMEPFINTTHINFESTNGRMKYHGPAFLGADCVPQSQGIGKGPSLDSSYLDPIGAEAISLIDPTNPNAEAGVALAEVVRERKLPLPGIQGWQRRTELAKAAGSEYLNAVFGWLPLVDEIDDFVQSVRDGNTIMENYGNASGTRVHREFSFDDIVSDDTTVISESGAPTVAGGTGLGFGFVATPGKITRRTQKLTKRWFSGSFTYHADTENSSFQSALGYGSEAEKLFGISLTPDILWELTPWSWAIDWFSNASNVIHNIGAMELAGLVMDYGYIMEETSTVETYSMTGFSMGGKYAGPVNIPNSGFVTVTKRRREANPFGFGLSWDGLSPTQLAITAALGILRLR